MKYTFLIALLLACLFALGGCMSQDDHDFFIKGWTNPKDLDSAPAQETPLRPSASDVRSGGVTPSARSAGDWSTPAPFL